VAAKVVKGKVGSASWKDARGNRRIQEMVTENERRIVLSATERA